MPDKLFITATLEDWILGSDNPYLPPEAMPRYINGVCYGHPNHHDGTIITTSRIQSHVEGHPNLIKTIAGSIYQLGTPRASYVEYCKHHNVHVPTEEEPIKWIENERGE